MGFDRGRFARRVGLLVLVVVLAACGARFRATGVVTGVEGSFDEIATFTVRTTDGDDLTFEPAPDGDFAFPLSHLRAHLVAGDPIVIEWVEVDGVLSATSLDDADSEAHRLAD